MSIFANLIKQYMSLCISGILEEITRVDIEIGNLRSCGMLFLKRERELPAFSVVLRNSTII